MLFVLLLGLVCLQQADRVLGEEIQGSGHNILSLLKTSSIIIFPPRKAKNILLFLCFTKDIIYCSVTLFYSSISKTWPEAVSWSYSHWFQQGLPDPSFIRMRFRTWIPRVRSYADPNPDQWPDHGPTRRSYILLAALIIDSRSRI